MLSEEWHILEGVSINLYQNGSILGEENKNIIKGAIKVSLKQKNIQNFVKILFLINL